MDKIAITPEEIATVADPANGGRAEVKLPPPITWIVRLVLLPLVLILPVLSIISVIVWVGVRNREPRLQHAWIRYMFILLTASGLTTTLGSGLWYLTMRPRQEMADLPSEPFSLDTTTTFPEFSATTNLSTENLVRKMEPVVLIVSRNLHGLAPSRRQLANGSFGAGVLLCATDEEYLIATCRHVVDGNKWQESPPFSGDVLICGREGGFGHAEIVGSHKSLDLTLLRAPRRKGMAKFVQPICRSEQISLGGRIVAFGHPQGMFYSVSDGLISRIDGTATVQISAPISPGASGGPIYDLRGRLLGIIASAIDKTSHPQAENLNFTVRADAFLHTENWNYAKGGDKLLAEFVAASASHDATVPEATSRSAQTPPLPESPTPKN
jgi:S1-C subfamily serine protease